MSATPWSTAGIDGADDAMGGRVDPRRDPVTGGQEGARRPAGRRSVIRARVRFTRLAALASAIIVLSGGAVTASAGGGALEIRDGYFWDPLASRFFLARGLAYQTWNPPVFANQSFEQVDYDLREFARMRANSLRVEFVWSEVEIEDGVFDWSKPDFLVARAEELGLKIFVIIGFQYPPPWFLPEWYATNDRGTRSDVLNYEDPRAQEAYTDFIRTVAARYRDSPAIAAWILGNEFAYFDLWEPPDLYPARRMLGYDPISLEAFREYLRNRYGGDIGALNGNWRTGYGGFDEVVMPGAYPADRDDPGYHDLIRWRQQSIGDFIARGAVAAREADPNHLLTYSMVGGIFNGNDANNTCEDGETIVARCAAAGAPLDFWSINNYAWATAGSELRSGDYGITKFQELLGMPVMLSETGHTSTETILPGASERQADAVPGTLWEAIVSGAAGVHLFHWSDRDPFLGGFFEREAGFGIVSQKRLPKPGVHGNTAAMLTRMAEIDVDNLLGGSAGPPKDLLFFWSGASEMGWPRANQETAMLWGVLKRLGYQPGLLGDAAFDAGRFGDAEALVLARGYQLEPDDLDRLETRVIPRGIHVHANADLPGRYDTYHRANPGWPARMRSLFGLDVSTAAPAWDAGVVGGFNETYREAVLRGAMPAGPLPPEYQRAILTWKIWEGVRAASGTTVLRHRPAGGAADEPALQLKDHGTAKAAATLVAVGDTFPGTDMNPEEIWNARSEILGAVYRDGFGIAPAVDLEGPGAAYVYPDFRICRNGTHLLSLLNGHTETAQVRVRSPLLAAGRTIENLTDGGILEPAEDGALEIELAGDAYVLLYLYDETGDQSRSLVNPRTPKLWIESAPAMVWPTTSDGVEVVVRHDTRGPDMDLAVALEMATPSGFRVLARSEEVAVSGAGSASLRVPVPDADLGNPDYRPSRDGGAFRLAASLSDRGAPVSRTTVPVRLGLGPRPGSLPPAPRPGRTYEIPVVWDDLPSYEPEDLGTLLGRAELWDSANATRSHYNIVLQLLDGDETVASRIIVTRRESGSHTFSITVPPGAVGPFTWNVSAQAAPGASWDVADSFEGRETGANIIWPPPDDPPPPREVDLVDPWQIYTYAHEGDPGRLYQNHGVHLEGSHGSQSMFLVMANPPDVGDYSGFGVAWVFPEPVVVPQSAAAREAFRFSFDFREEARLACTLEMQLKDADGGAVIANREYLPGPDGWDAMDMSLADFELAPWSNPQRFDWDRVTELVINVAMLETGAALQYVCSIDNILFDAPESVVTGGPVVTAYRSGNDSLPDTDRDGIADAYETGTGVLVSDTDTGTDSTTADSDGDGQSDGEELAGGSDPNSASDTFRIQRIERSADGLVTLVFRARTGRLYGVERWTRDSADAPGEFRLIPGYAGLTVGSDGLASVEVVLPPGEADALLRLTAARSESSR